MAITCTLDATNQANFNNSAVGFCFPPVAKCEFLPSGLLVECGAGWNCNKLCDTDSSYSIPIPADGVMYLQTIFFDDVSPDRTNPTALFEDLVTLEICSNLNPSAYVPITVAEIGLANNCFDGKRNRQNLCIDASVIDTNIECFNLRFTVGDTCVESQQFRIERTCSESLVKLESTGFTDDCDGYFYGDFEACAGDDITFSNVIYIRGRLKDYGGQVNPTYFGSLKTNAEVLRRYRIIGNELIPPYMANYLLNQIFGGSVILVDDVEFRSEQTIELSPAGRNSMFHVNAELNESCVRAFGCS